MPPEVPEWVPREMKEILYCSPARHVNELHIRGPPQ